MSSFCIYATGFVGSSDVVRDVLVNSKAVQTTGNAVEISSSSVHPVNRKIVDNYITLLRDPRVALTFDFREKVIRDVKEAFGMPFLDPWFGANYKAGYLDPIRQRFLDECVNYFCGKGRGMPMNIYMSSIGIATDKEKAGEMSATLSDFLCVSMPESAMAQNTIKTTEVIQSWLAQPNGFGDLVSAAMIFWGDNSIR